VVVLVIMIVFVVAVMYTALVFVRVLVIVFMTSPAVENHQNRKHQFLHGATSFVFTGLPTARSRSINASRCESSRSR
jgi:hypothetical protein